MNVMNENDTPIGYSKQNNLYSPQLTITAPLPVCGPATGSRNGTRRSPKDEYEQPDLTLPSVSSF
jgi:hypothetical protein